MGVEHQSQNENIHYKQMNSGEKIKYFRNTDLWYQGSYELDFLEKYYDKYSDIKRGPSIKYNFQRKNKIYFPDFYIPSLNLIVECKNSYRAKNNKIILQLKENAVKNMKFNFLMIINKNYSDFELFLRNFSVR